MTLENLNQLYMKV